MAGDTVVCVGYTEAGAGEAPLHLGRLRRRRRHARPPPQGPPAAGRALRLHRRRALRGVRHAGRPDRDAHLLRQALPRGGPRARARRRRHRRLPGRLAGLPPAPRAARRAGPPDAPLQPHRRGARGREPGRLGLRQPDRHARAAALPRQREGRRSRRRRARAHRQPAGMALARIDAPAAVRESRLGIDHLADRRPAAYAATRRRHPRRARWRRGR